MLATPAVAAEQVIVPAAPFPSKAPQSLVIERPIPSPQMGFALRFWYGNGWRRSRYQLEALLSYRITPLSSVGGAGRYWHMESNGSTRFEVVGGMAQPVN
jgi:hypothetical protein